VAWSAKWFRMSMSFDSALKVAIVGVFAVVAGVLLEYNESM